MTDYSNWKVLKSVINYRGDDEEKQAAAQAAQAEYSEVSFWCDENPYTIEETEKYYQTVYIPEPEPHIPTNEEIRQMRERSYQYEVDPITAHIQRLRDTTPMTPEIEAEIDTLVVERDAKFTEIQERYPYHEE